MTKQAKQVLIRCDVNDANGYGHFTRCLYLARGIKEKHPGAAIKFCGEYTKPALELLASYGIEAIPLTKHDSNDSSNLKVYIANTDYVILDTYLLTQAYINDLCSGSYKFVVIDDYGRYDLAKVDLVVNFGINFGDFTYTAKQQALGIKYFPFKPELKKVRERNLSSTPAEIKNILVMIGGYDKFSVGKEVVKCIDGIISGATISLLGNTQAPEKGSIKNNELKIIPFCNNIETVYNTTDIAITGGGVSKYESVYCCIPNGSVSQNTEEYADSLYFDRLKLNKITGTSYDFNREQVMASIKELFTLSCRTQLIDNCKKAFDTDSLANLVNEIILD
jgi:spore coat polysaccharide biosynthesis predicted glycosyltransferase SpsG